MQVRLVLIASAALTASCMMQAQRAQPVMDPAAMRVVRIWVQPHADLPTDVIMAACNMWNLAEVRCEQITLPSTVQILVFASAKKCVREDGIRKLAWSRKNGTIQVCTDCFTGFFGDGLQSMKLAVAHEVGHQLGIWEHVSAFEGKALMNSFLNEDLKELTELDLAAYRQQAPH